MDTTSPAAQWAKRQRVVEYNHKRLIEALLEAYNRYPDILFKEYENNP